MSALRCVVVALALAAGCAPSGHQIFSHGTYDLIVNNTGDGTVNVAVADYNYNDPTSGGIYGDPVPIGEVGPHSTGYFLVSTGRFALLLNGVEEGIDDFSPDGTPVIAQYP